MIQQEKINVRGAINSLDVGDSLKVPRIDRTPSIVRNTAYLLKIDTGKDFTVTIDEENTIVTRTN